ncbi:glycosyltransferase family 1 protein [Sphingomonas sp. LY29]|uniref:glycosyltransferase family 4 protein n=1 Tax=Sphingomonas sp. LY29 TaxID=3095341 RepID=UPI002D76E94B|nr:glycosyltransferase family 1 protein [Sphingomonas sp. LY29]WRP26339.1 glycosyltransferase family 1 protein [Sphingomonas sp. LY29]
MSSIRGIAINGRFLGRPVSGVERYGREILRAWDRRLHANPVLPRPRILVPAGAHVDLPLSAMSVERVGRRQGHSWEQFDLGRAARHDVLISLANSGPVLHRRHLVVVHDAAVFRFGENYGFRYRTLHRALGRLLARTAQLATVSRFSQCELARFLRLAPNRILVAGNGSEHLAGAVADEGVIERLGLIDRRFLLTVGTASHNKNLALALAAWAKLPSSAARLVVVGPINDRVFAASGLSAINGVVLAGRLSDDALTALYRHANALVFPSRYEGFGIPPVEAMANGCPVLAAAIPPVQEVCGDEARYFDPDDADGLARLMTERLESTLDLAETDRLRARAAGASWASSAAKIADAAIELARA